MTGIAAHALADDADQKEDLLAGYKNCLSFIERLHRMLLDVIKDEFERLKVHDVTGSQALLMFNIGQKEVTVGELKARGYYVGSNASYTLKKLSEGGYVINTRCSVDRRVIRVKLTEKGFEMVDLVTALLGRHVEEFEVQGPLGTAALSGMGTSMRTLERFWTDRIRFIY